MHRSPRSTIIEIFPPGAWVTHFQYPATGIGLTHYGVWNDRSVPLVSLCYDWLTSRLMGFYRRHSLRLFTSPDTPATQVLTDDWQSTDIPVDGEVVSKLIHQRLSIGQNYSYIELKDD